MRQITKEAILKLQKETSRVLTVEDFDLIEELDAVASEFAGVNKTERRILDAPFYACGLRFYPFTIAKSIWYQEKLEEFEIASIYQEAFLFWVLTLPNDEFAFDDFETIDSINKAMRKMSRKLTCSSEEMQEIFRKCIGSSGGSDDEQSSDSTDYGGLIACLLKEYGGTVNKWLWETPIETVAKLFDEYAARVQAEAQANRSQAAKGGKAVAPRNDARIAAMAKLRRKINEIREIWSKDNG